MGESEISAISEFDVFSPHIVCPSNANAGNELFLSAPRAFIHCAYVCWPLALAFGSSVEFGLRETSYSCLTVSTKSKDERKTDCTPITVPMAKRLEKLASLRGRWAFDSERNEYDDSFLELEQYVNLYCIRMRWNGIRTRKKAHMLRTNLEHVVATYRKYETNSGCSASKKRTFGNKTNRNAHLKQSKSTKNRAIKVNIFTRISGE